MELIPTDEITGLWSYLASIDWKDPWFMMLGLFHLICFMMTYLTRRHITAQGIVFAFFLVAVGCSEYINKFAALHWRSFSRQQYFDSSGLFISVVFSMPILINCLIIVVLWLKTSADLMRGIRRKQMHLQARQQSGNTPDKAGARKELTTRRPDLSQSSPRNRK